MLCKKENHTDSAKTLKTVFKHINESADFSVADFTITNLKCDCYGYNACENEIEAAKTSAAGESDSFWDWRIYEARWTDFKNYDGAMTGGEFSLEFPYPLEMVKSIHMTFPTNTWQTTYFYNPYLKDMRLKLNNILYPRNDALDTDTLRFYHMQCRGFEYDEDVRFSYLCQPFDKDGNYNERPAISQYIDNSNFIATWDLASGPFMAINTFSDNINIHFSAKRKYKNSKIYGCVAGTGSAIVDKDSLPSPQIWFTHDAFWILTMSQGLQFCNTTPAPVLVLQSENPDVHMIPENK